MKASKLTGKSTLAKPPWFWEKNNSCVINAEILNKVPAIYSYFMITYCFIWVAPKHLLKVKGRRPVSSVTSFCIWVWWQSCSRMPACCLLPPRICSDTSLSQQRSRSPAASLHRPALPVPPCTHLCPPPALPQAHLCQEPGSITCFLP